MLCAEEEPRFQRTRMHCEKLRESLSKTGPKVIVKALVFGNISK